MLCLANGECRFAVCPNAEGRYADSPYTDCRNDEYSYAESH